ncbi:hypothetical protein E2C01_024398 [Portunus trituberculatus]|uniref:Uncharacterized protein n=1 Tax=Portunus trituberculatus TaxID=210409 RepID=A0A5B7ECQ7_PORTR|nr:hypothetical protein [Portunus trituberculatus]
MQEQVASQVKMGRYSWGREDKGGGWRGVERRLIRGSGHCNCRAERIGSKAPTPSYLFGFSLGLFNSDPIATHFHTTQSRQRGRKERDNLPGALGKTAVGHFEYEDLNEMINSPDIRY